MILLTEGVFIMMTKGMALRSGAVVLAIAGAFGAAAYAQSSAETALKGAVCENDPAGHTLAAQLRITKPGDENFIIKERRDYKISKFEEGGQTFCNFSKGGGAPIRVPYVPHYVPVR